jgi:hypothetical protein
MAFMRPVVTSKQEWAGVETTAGFWWVPIDVLSKSEIESARRGDFEPLLKYTEGGRVYSDQSSIKKGYGVRLSASGYMDATDWEVYGSKKEALRRARELAEEEEEEGTPPPGHATRRHATKKRDDRVVRPDFGKERTPQQMRARAQWEREQAAKIRAAKQPVGWEHIVEAHEHAARAYEQLARERSK